MNEKDKEKSQILIKLRQNFAAASASLQHTEQQYNQALAEARRWQQLQQRIHDQVQPDARSDSMREALGHQKRCEEKARRLKLQIEEQTTNIEKLKRTIAFWESEHSTLDV